MSHNVLIQTAEDLFAMRDNSCRRELVGGVLREMPFHGSEHGQISLLIGGYLHLHVRECRLGAAFGSGTGFLIAENPDTVLAPDVAFVAEDRLQGIRDLSKFVPLAPDLAVEVLSPGDTERESLLKVGEWLSAGTRAVIVVNPRTQTVTVHRSAVQTVVLTSSDQLEVPEIVPGWSVAVADIFGSV